MHLLRSAAEPTRLRILALLAAGELSVSDIAAVLGQSQPRVSRHLKVLCDAGLLSRTREQHWIYYRLADTGAPGEFVRSISNRWTPPIRRSRSTSSAAARCGRGAASPRPRRRLRRRRTRGRKAGSSAPCSARSSARHLSTRSCMRETHRLRSFRHWRAASTARSCSSAPGRTLAAHASAWMGEGRRAGRAAPR